MTEVIPKMTAILRVFPRAGKKRKVCWLKSLVTNNKTHFSLLNQNTILRLGTLVYACNFSTEEAERGRFQVQGQPGLHREALSQSRRRRRRRKQRRWMKKKRWHRKIFTGYYRTRELLPGTK